MRTRVAILCMPIIISLWAEANSSYSCIKESLSAFLQQGLMIIEMCDKVMFCKGSLPWKKTDI